MSTKVGSIHYDLSLNTDPFEAASAKIQGNLKSLGSQLESFGSSMQGIGAQLTASLTAPLAAAGFAGIKTASDLESARMGFITLLGSAQKADSTLQRIKDEAKRTPFEIVGLTQATQLLASVTKDGDRALNFILNIGEGLAAMGRGQAELDRISVNLQQIAAVGKAQMIDIKQFAFAGIPIFEMLAMETGLAGDALDKFISEGGVSFAMLEKMFASATAEGGRFFGAYKNQTGTLAQLMSNLKDQFAISMSDIIVQSGLFDVIKNKVKALTDTLSNLGNMFKSLTPEQKQLVVNLGLFLLVLGPLLVILGTLVSTVGKLIPLFTFFASPVGLIALKIAALVGVLIFLETRFKIFSNALEQVYNFVAPIFIPIWEHLVSIFQNELIPAFNQLMQTLEPIMPVLQFIAMVIMGVLAGAFMAIIVLISMFARGLSVVMNALSGFINWIASTAQAFASFRQNIIGNVINFINGLPQTFYNAGKGLFEAFKNGIASAANGVVEKVKSVLGKIRSMLPFSDAKVGPLSNLTYSGTQLGETFAKGILMSQNAIDKAMNTIIPNPTMLVTAGGMDMVAPQKQGDINIQIGQVNDRTDMDYLINRIDMNQRMQIRGVAPL